MARRNTALKQKASILNLEAEREARQNGPQTKKKFTIHDLRHVTPLNDTQNEVFQNWNDRELNLSLFGFPGTGKTFLGMYLALQTLLLNRDKYDKIIVVRSIVPVRDIGFLPGELDEKIAVYEEPYKQICNELFKWNNSWNNLKELGMVEFQPTSFIRGTTWSNSIVIVDEIQNMQFEEAWSVLTRVGEDSRVILCGDADQTDINPRKEKSCWDELQKLLLRMPTVAITHFNDSDMVVRSQFVRDLIKARYK